MVIWATQSVRSHVTQIFHKAKTGVGGIHYTVDEILCDLAKMIIWASQSVRLHVTQTFHKAKTGVGDIQSTRFHVT